MELAANSSCIQLNFPIRKGIQIPVDLCIISACRLSQIFPNSSRFLQPEKSTDIKRLGTMELSNTNRNGRIGNKI